MARRRARRNSGEGRIYVADLAAYNEGFLQGEWIEPASDVATLSEQIDEVLKNVKRKGHPVGEEWAIHDYDMFPDCGEYPDLAKVAKIAEIMESPSADATLALMKSDPYWARDPDGAMKRAEENLAGVFKDAKREFVYYLEEEGLLSQETLERHIDYEQFGRDVRMDLDEEGDDKWATEMSDVELGEHYVDDVDIKDMWKTLQNYVDHAAIYRDLELGGEIDVVRYEGQDYVFWTG